MLVITAEFKFVVETEGVVLMKMMMVVVEVGVVVGVAVVVAEDAEIKADSVNISRLTENVKFSSQDIHDLLMWKRSLLIIECKTDR